MAVSTISKEFILFETSKTITRAGGSGYSSEDVPFTRPSGYIVANVLTYMNSIEMLQPLLAVVGDDYLRYMIKNDHTESLTRTLYVVILFVK